MRYLFLLLLLFSCAETETTVEHDEYDHGLDLSIAESFSVPDYSISFITEKSKWICHHPKTSFHNKECVEEEYPVGCYVNGNLHKFCWLLHIDDCNNPIDSTLIEACRNVGYLK